jgi:glycerol kinase
VDGGMAANDWLMQAVADQVQRPVERPAVLETTAWGAARLAGLHAGIYPPLGTPGLRRVERTFQPTADSGASDALHAGWLRAVTRVRS